MQFYKRTLFIFIHFAIYGLAMAPCALTLAQMEDNVNSEPTGAVDGKDSRTEFFKLIHGSPELTRVKDDNRLKDEPTRAPASNKNDTYDFLLGAEHAQNPEERVTYFLEVRKHDNVLPVLLRQNPSHSAPLSMRLMPGQIIRVDDTASDYLATLRLEQRNNGAWKKIDVSSAQENLTIHMYYQWQTMFSIGANLQPVELKLNIPPGRNVITVFNKPGRWTPTDCQASEDLCVGWPDQYAKVFLFDTKIIDLKEHVPGEHEFALFYNVGFSYKTANGDYKNGMGWIPASQAVRNLNFLPQSLDKVRSLAATGFMTEKQRREQFQSFFLFKKNATTLDSQNTRWTRFDKNNRGQGLFDVKIAWDAIFKTGYNNLNQTFLTDPLVQYVVTPGVRASAPIFIDLDISGEANISMPVASEGSLEPAYILKLDQWLTYTAPLRLGDTPLRFGFGGYYTTMLNSNSNYGFRSLVGFQGKVQLENATNWYYIRYGAVGADLNFEFRNREVGFGLGYRLDPDRRFDGWSIFAEISDTQYKSPNTETVTDLDQIAIGVMRGF